MADTKRALQAIDLTDVDLELVETLLSARSSGEALVAYRLLEAKLPARALVMLANLRELILLLPEEPFITGSGMDVLVRALGYEDSGRSYRKLFDGSHGMYGIEFVGRGTLCEGINVHTETSRYSLHGTACYALDHRMLQVFVHHQRLLDAILEALVALGYVLSPRIYVTAEDFVADNGALAAAETLGQLF